MSKTTIALEAAVATLKENLPVAGERQTARQRAAVDKAFARILTLIAPRIRHFIRQYGLVGHWEDAEQVCSIAVHRAIEAYEPEKAQFTTFINWQIRGELQSLRFRLMTDQRPSARKVEATTVSLDAISTSEDGEDISAIALIEDEEALFRTEAGASAYLAEAATISLIDGYIEHLRNVALERMRRQVRPKRAAKNAGETRQSVWRSENLNIDPAELEELELRLSHNRQVVERRLFDIATLDTLEGDTGVNKERVRQVAKRAAKTMAELAMQDSRFSIMADYRETRPAGPTVH
jgi:RNA polymerase sigma-32 factor